MGEYSEECVVSMSPNVKNFRDLVDASQKYIQKGICCRVKLNGTGYVRTGNCFELICAGDYLQGEQVEVTAKNYRENPKKDLEECVCAIGEILRRDPTPPIEFGELS